MPTGVYVRTAKHRMAISAGQTGKTRAFTESHKLALSRAAINNTNGHGNLGNKHSLESRHNMSVAHIGIHQSEETKIKKRAGLIKWWMTHDMRRSDTKIERAIEHELNRRKIRHRKQKYMKFAKCFVDFFIEPNIVIECDGDYFHCNPKSYKPEYYNARLKMTAANKWKQDADRSELMKRAGYVVYRFWECDIHKDVAACVDSIDILRS